VATVADDLRPRSIDYPSNVGRKDGSRPALVSIMAGPMLLESHGSHTIATGLAHQKVLDRIPSCCGRIKLAGSDRHFISHTFSHLNALVSAHLLKEKRLV